MKSIFLTGFMGAGKSTTGKELAKLLNCRFVDLDHEIVKQQGRSINEIFSLEGEPFFRRCESEILEKITINPVTVYATGGGIVIDESNRALMRSKGMIIYLNAQWTTLKDRLKSSQDRPLVDPGHNWGDVEQRFLARQASYQDADLVVDTDGLKPRQVAQMIIRNLEP